MLENNLKFMLKITMPIYTATFPQNLFFSGGGSFVVAFAKPDLEMIKIQSRDTRDLQLVHTVVPSVPLVD